MSRCACAVLAIVAACGKGTGTTAGTGSAAGSASEAGSAVESHCVALPFAESTPVPEASGAAWIFEDGKPELVVIGDSGNDGAYGIIDPETGATIETGKLPLGDGAGDDLEGFAALGPPGKEKLYGLISSGWMRVWQRKDKGFELLEQPYALGPVDLPNEKHNDKPPQGDGMVCPARGTNCGRNYEGLCLAPKPSATCVGFAASKADGHLYCLTDEAGKLVVHHDRAIAIGRPGVVADCAFAEDNSLWVGSNLFDLGRVYRVTGWEELASAKVQLVGILAIGFPETLAVRGDVVYRMSDTGGAPSLMVKYRCPR